MRRGFLLGSADTGARASSGVRDGRSTGAAQASGMSATDETGAAQASGVSATDEAEMTFNPHPKKPENMTEAEWDQFKVRAMMQLKHMLALGIDMYVTDSGQIWSQQELKQLLEIHDEK
ncbi:unnamed protein product [Symbiodinium sp. CCMP2592]|nr:unnamed protein product [Symbiodinium sp. CCMP2592]